MFRCYIIVLGIIQISLSIIVSFIFAKCICIIFQVLSDCSAEGKHYLCRQIQFVVYMYIYEL